jgi:lactate dehydrogenase-like 2-hydroxyacid dehydrogenase
VTDATADIAMLLLLGASRRGFEAQELVRTGEWTLPRRGALLGWQLTGKILGILGMGRIGQAVAKRARALAS